MSSLQSLSLSVRVGVISVLQFCNLRTPIHGPLDSGANIQRSMAYLSNTDTYTLPPIRVAWHWPRALISLQLGPFVSVTHGIGSLSAGAGSVRFMHFRYGRTVTRSRATAKKPGDADTSSGFNTIGPLDQPLMTCPRRAPVLV